MQSRMSLRRRRLPRRSRKSQLKSQRSHKKRQQPRKLVTSKIHHLTVIGQGAQSRYQNASMTLSLHFDELSFLVLLCYVYNFCCSSFASCFFPFPQSLRKRGNVVYCIIPLITSHLLHPLSSSSHLCYTFLASSSHLCCTSLTSSSHLFHHPHLYFIILS